MSMVLRATRHALQPPKPRDAMSETMRMIPGYDTPRTNALAFKWSAREGSFNSTCSPEAHDLYDIARQLERELTQSQAENAAQRTVINLLFERFPDCRAMGDLPGCVDEERAKCAELEEAIIAMAEDGWLYHGVEGMSESQEKCYQAYLAIQKRK